MRYIAVSLLALLLLAGCATTQDVSPQGRSRTFDASKEAVYDATLAYLLQEGYQIEVSNKESGAITTAYRRSGAYERARLSALAQGKYENQARVILTVAAESRPSDDWDWTAAQYEAPKAAKIYSEHLSGIESQLRR